MRMIRTGGGTDNPVSARRAQTQQRLMMAAREVFAEKGVGGASVEEICEVAGFTRGAFYSNFDTKDDLCLALLRDVGSGFLASVRTAIGASDNADGDAETLVDSAVDLFLTAQPGDREATLLMIELQLYAIRHPGFTEAYISVREETHALFVEVIGEALARRGLAFALPTSQVVEILHAVHDGAQASALLKPASPNPLAGTLKALLAALIR